MENISNGNQTYNFDYDIWYANIIISGILTILSAYITSALIYHETRIESKKDKFSRQSIEHKFALISRLLCILIAVISLFRNIIACIRLSMAEIHEEPTEIISTAHRNATQLQCQVVAKLGNVLLTLGMAFVYLFLWFRQRLFFVHPSLKVLSNKFVKIISFSIIIVWLIYYAWSITYYLTLVQYHFNHECLTVQSTASYRLYFVMSWVIVSFVMQIGLLALFLYPFFKKDSWKTRKDFRNSRLMRRVKKAVALASTCLISDIVIAAVGFALSLLNSSSSLFAVFSINLLGNLLVTVGCFDNWQQLLWPWQLKPKKTLTRKQGKSAETNNRSASTNETQDLNDVCVDL